MPETTKDEKKIKKTPTKAVKKAPAKPRAVKTKTVTAAAATTTTVFTPNPPAPKPLPKPDIIITRQPVVVVMGHIDHGKSTLLDFIRKSNIVAGEAGGITQHLGAYEVAHKIVNPNTGNTNINNVDPAAAANTTKNITFLDTPGHEAFAGIRSRGANAADIAVLVVSAEDGVKPQTLEALKCIKDANLPYIVAINKIDKPNADPERTKINLAEHEIYLEGFGGDIPFVPISALTGQGVPELLDMILLVSELGDYKANISKPATGIVIETHRDSQKGVSATLLIKDGTLNASQFVVAENATSPVRIFEDWSGRKISKGNPGSPVRVIGFNHAPKVGATFTTVNDKKQAENLASSFVEKNLTSTTPAKAPARVAVTSADEPVTPIIYLIIKADVTGSLDGIKHEIAKIKFPPVEIRIVSEGLGDIGEKDLKLTNGLPNTYILGFNVLPDAKARPMIERAPSIGTPYNVHTYRVIYELIQFIADKAKSMVPKEKVLVELGFAKIMAIFSKNKDKQIIGGKVQKGTITLGSEVKILRREAEIGTGRVRELQQQKAKAQEVNEGYEFGALIESKIEILQGDKIQAFEIVEK